MINCNPVSTLSKQKGMATLLTSVILLIAVTLISFLTAKAVLKETQMTANNKRAQQAFSAADAAMEYAVAYFNGNGFSIAGLDHDSDGDINDADDVINPNPLISSIIFNNNDGVCTTAGNLTSALITTTGSSDDGTASRTIIQCVGTRNLLKGGGPKQTLVSGGSVGLTGSAQIINRYTDLNVWSAENTSIGNSSAMSTYIRPVDMEISDLTKDQLIELPAPAINNAQKVSSNGLGAGTDVYMNDDRLADAMTITNANGSDYYSDASPSFFNLFFTEPQDAMARLANGIGQKLATGASNAELAGLSGVIWVDGDASITATGTILGSAGNPALLIVDGDFSFSGGSIYGLVYVTGATTITGSPNVQGSFISEGSVSGTGTLDLVYSRNIGNGDGDVAPLKGTTSIISGSWRDW